MILHFFKRINPILYTFSNESNVYSTKVFWFHERFSTVKYLPIKISVSKTPSSSEILTAWEAFYSPILRLSATMLCSLGKEI